MKKKFGLLLFSWLVACETAKKLPESAANSLHVIINVRQDNDALNNLLVVFNGIQKPDKMKIYYPGSTPNAATVDCAWNRMDGKDILKIKKYCEKLPEKISVEYEEKQ